MRRLHWCPNGCGKKVMHTYYKKDQHIYLCPICLSYFGSTDTLFLEFNPRVKARVIKHNVGGYCNV